MSTTDTLATLCAVQADIEEVAAKILRDAQAMKPVIERHPLPPELPDLRRDAEQAATRSTSRRRLRIQPGSRADLVRRGAMLVKGA